MAYTRADKDLPDDPRLMEAAEQLYVLIDVSLAERTASELSTEFDCEVDFSSSDARELMCNAMLGGLVRLWTYADTYIRSDNLLPLSPGQLARVMRLPQWCVRLYPADWIEIDEDDCRVVLPGFVEKNGIKPRDIRKEDRQLQRDKWKLQKQNQRRSKKAKNGADNGADIKRTRRGQRGGHAPSTGTGPVPLTNTGTVPESAPLAADPERAAAARQKLRGLAEQMRVPATAKGSGS